MSVWFTSDHHFGQGGARGLFRRPFASTAEMDQAMIERWNALVRPDDTVWHLGDLVIRPKAGQVDELLAVLNGRKQLIAGNNDPLETREAGGWQSVAEFREIELDGRLLVLCHYPLRSWNGMGKGAIQLHGHSHGKLKPLTRQVDVGVDCWDFRPVDLTTILAARRRRGSQ